ncbi:MAG: polysaccharide biosynthesis protein [Acidobacteria bacterium]|nr:polysaccharide biosynthesis protein [Acidobacteriota bacterium]
MRRHLSNAAYGVLDYASYPMGMLLVAPVVLHRLGAAEYGLWITSTAVISAGGIVASGFSDANIQRVAQHRGRGKYNLIAETAASLLGINLALGATLAVCAWIAAPFAARHLSASQVTNSEECLFCLRMASVGILFRAIETVAVSTQRAFEDYRATVRISTLCRFLTLGLAAVLVCAGQRMPAVLLMTVLMLAFGVYLQFRSLRRFLGSRWLRPVFDNESRVLLGLGVFPWVQAVGGIVFGQLDRILLGLYLGTLAVAPYALCVQFAQPIIGVAASGLSFLFPYLSGRVNSLSRVELRSTIFKAFTCNLVFVGCCTIGLLAYGERLMQLWAGAAVARSASGLLLPIVLGSAIAGLGTTATYSMQALGHFRTVALVSVGGRGAMLLVMAFLLQKFGMQGLAYSRLWYGLIPMLIYIPLLRDIRAKSSERREAESLAIACREGSTL